MRSSTFFGNTAETGNNIQTDGLVAYWDAAYKKSYVSGSSKTYNLASGSLTPTGSLSDSNGSGMYSSDNQGTWVFDGVDDGINIGSIGPNTGVTFNIWFKIGGAAGSRAYGVIISHWYVTNYCFIGTDLNNPDDIVVYFDGLIRFTITDQPFQTWKLLTITHDGSNIIGYINGVQTNTSAGSLATITTGDTSIGWDVNRSNYPFLGQIASVQIYNRALSVGDVLQNYNAQKDRFGY